MPTRRAPVSPAAASGTDATALQSDLSRSKSQQLALAVAADAQRDNTSQQYRPDSLWSEGGADVVWHGNQSSRKASERGLPSPALPSPGILSSTHTKVSSASGSHGDFADADEGYDSDSRSSYEGHNTTFTTMSTSDSATSKSTTVPPRSAHTDDEKNALTPTPSAARLPMGALQRPPRLPRHQASPQPPPASFSPTTAADRSSFEGSVDDAVSTFGHSRNTSIGSSIWAGRGARLEAMPPVPRVPNHLSPMDTPESANVDRFSTAETTSVYSEGGASDFEEAQAQDTQRAVDRALERNGLRTGTMSGGACHARDAKNATERYQDDLDHSEMASQDDGEKTQVTSQVSPPRTLADGTRIPPIPPMPDYEKGANGRIPAQRPNAARSRSKQGRRNRSPVLSYADGEAEEQRLVLEREMREHGSAEPIQDTSNMGPRLKKNSPAPWEMDEEDNVEDFIKDRQSHDGPISGLSSRPSFDQLFPPSLKSTSAWGRSRTNTAGRNLSPIPLSSNTKDAPPLPMAFPSASVSPVSLDPTSAADTSAETTMSREPLEQDPRRRRTKSVTSSAQGVLKSMGIGHGAHPSGAVPSSAAKKDKGSHGGSRLAKAFRKAGAASSSAAVTPGRTSVADTSAGSRKGSLNLSRGISSEDYANLPPSPRLVNNSLHPSGSISTNSYSGIGNDASTRSFSSQSQASGEAIKDPSIPTHPLRQGKSDSPSQQSMSHQHSPLQHGNIDEEMTAEASGSRNHDGSEAHSTQSKSADATHSPTDSAAFAAMLLDARHCDRSDKAPLQGLGSQMYNVQGLPDTKMPGGRSGSASSSDRGNNLASPVMEAVKMHNQSVQKQRKVSREPDISAQLGGDPHASSSATLGTMEAKERRTAGPGTQSHTAQPSRQQALTETSEQKRATPKLPILGEHNGVPYKLISLEEARAQHAAVHKSSQNGGVEDRHEETSLPPAASERTIHGAEERDNGRLRAKKSAGFLRRFGNKERSTNSLFSEAAGERDAPSSLTGLSSGASQQSHLTVADMNAPLLSVRPMSSMFNGFAPELLDQANALESIKETSDTRENLLQPPGASKGSAHISTPNSPAITIQSADSLHSSSGADYQDALERTPSFVEDNDRVSAGQNAAGLQRPRGASTSSGTQRGKMNVPRHSHESAQSDTSSALGLVNGFPATPASPYVGTTDGYGGTVPDFGNDSGQSLAAATRKRALDIEVRMSDLAAELAQLRAFAVDAGLARADTAQAQSPKEAGREGDSQDSPLGRGSSSKHQQQHSQPQSTDSDVIANALSHGSDSIDSKDVPILQNPIPPCDQCGCMCAERRRQQTLNELSVLKGIR